MSGIGHIGELDFINFLKKKGYEIYLPLKDRGIDFVGVKNNNLLQIQVKTSIYQKESYFWFDLYGEKMHYSKNTYYVFVCKTLTKKTFMGKKENYFIVPSLTIKKWIKGNKLAIKANSKDVYNIFLYPNFESKKWIYKNKGKEIDFTKYWDKVIF